MSSTSNTADNATSTVSTRTRKSASDKLFGRDEMAALLSVDASMPTAASSGHAGGSSRNSKKRGGANGKDEEIDISRLNAYETAEYLSRLKQQKITQHNRKRLRADTSKMEYQKLLEEQQEASTFHLTPVPAAAAPQRSSVQEEYKEKIVPQHNSREDETSNASVSSSSSSNSNENHYRRRRREPEIIIRKSEPRKEERSISSSSSSSVESSSSSSESEEEIDARRRRIREKAMAYTQSTTPSIDKPLRNEEKAEEEATTQSNGSPSLSFSKKMNNTGSDAVSTDEDSSSSPSSSSSEDEATSNLGHHCRPLFIPKHQRVTNKLDSIQQQQQQEQEEKERQRIRQKRKQESRAMVKQIVLQSKEEIDTLNNYNSISIEEEDLVTGMGVNPPPDDTDTCETKEDELRMYHTWQVRELLRILREQDEREEKEYEQAEILRRRTLTDEERLAEDEASGRYQRPGSNRVTKKGNYLQRYYHKGAFYADEEDNDLHGRAEEYARAPTGQDKIDFASLPKVMQVKKFGFARYSTKYKGLSKEDTTDKFAPQLLPPKR